MFQASSGFVLGCFSCWISFECSENLHCFFFPTIKFNHCVECYYWVVDSSALIMLAKLYGDKFQLCRGCDLHATSLFGFLPVKGFSIYFLVFFSGTVNTSCCIMLPSICSNYRPFILCLLFLLATILMYLVYGITFI